VVVYPQRRDQIVEAGNQDRVDVHGKSPGGTRTLVDNTGSTSSKTLNWTTMHAWCGPGKKPSRLPSESYADVWPGRNRGPG
jgi:hypothetical protein